MATPGDCRANPPPLRVSEHMDLGPAELVGRSCYQFVHGQDAARIRQSHLDREDPPLLGRPRPQSPLPEVLPGVIPVPPLPLPAPGSQLRAEAQQGAPSGAGAVGAGWLRPLTHPSTGAAF